MRALILAAGVGSRLGGGGDPKCLLRFEGKTLLRRHVEILEACGVGEAVVAVGYRAATVRAEIAGLAAGIPVGAVENPDYERGNIVTLWTLRDALTAGGDILLMDADVLYDHRLLRRLLRSRHENCLLLDREVEPGDEPVKLCIRGGKIVEFRKRVAPGLAYDFHGESVGFFRMTAAAAGRLREIVETYVGAGRRDEHYEEALRDLVLAEDGPAFGCEEITGLPWIEIDFPADADRAAESILPRLEELPAR